MVELGWRRGGKRAPGTDAPGTSRNCRQLVRGLALERRRRPDGSGGHWSSADVPAAGTQTRDVSPRLRLQCGRCATGTGTHDAVTESSW